MSLKRNDKWTDAELKMFDEVCYSSVVDLYYYNNGNDVIYLHNVDVSDKRHLMMLNSAITVAKTSGRPIAINGLVRFFRVKRYLKKHDCNTTVVMRTVPSYLKEQNKYMDAEWGAKLAENLLGRKVTSAKLEDIYDEFYATPDTEEENGGE